MTAGARRAGFSSLAPFADALAWIDAHIGRLPAEAVAVQDACGRVLAHPLTTTADWPDVDRAAIDGYAVSAEDTEGASDYSPLALRMATFVSSGATMPDGADAVIACSMTGSTGGATHALAAVARGAGVVRRGGDAPLGFQIPPGALRPEAAALLTLLGIATVTVTGLPRVGLVVADPKSGPDVLAPMLRALIARDGGITVQRIDLASLLTDDVSLILLVGPTGSGRDDDMAMRLGAAGGMLDLHGIAMRPGESAGLGKVHGIPVMLMPGTPAEALAAWDLVAGPSVRAMGGRMPGAARPAMLGRKITSMVGVTDLVRVGMADGHAMPLGPADTGGLGRAVLSDGWVVVPDGHEGYPAGAAVAVHSPWAAGA